MLNVSTLYTSRIKHFRCSGCHIDIAFPFFSDEARGSQFEPTASSSKQSSKLLSSYTRHSAKPNSSEENLTCPFCGETSITAFLLKRHISSTHNQQLPFRCQLCGKGFISSSGLRHHRRGAHMGRCFVCDFCGARFKHKHHMNDHVRKFHSQYL